jgi:hypothetical protein
VTAPQIDALPAKDGHATQRQQAETMAAAVARGCRSSWSTMSRLRLPLIAVVSRNIAMTRPSAPA